MLAKLRKSIMTCARRNRSSTKGTHPNGAHKKRKGMETTADRFFPPLSIVFIWNSKDSKCQGIVDKCYNYLSKDKKSPFSRSLNIPVFIRTALNANELDPIEYHSDNVLLFPFITETIATRREWIDYIEYQAEKKSDTRKILIPIGLCSSSSRVFKDCLAEMKYIDYNGEDVLDDRIIMRVLHEVYRWTLSPESTLIDADCKLFISHTKNDEIGLKVSLAIRDFIHKDGRMRTFFDCKNLIPGRDNDYNNGFDEQFFDKVSESTLVAVCSDAYSSRHWCQMEMIHAKKIIGR